MLRLPNPGSDINALIQIFQAIYRALQDRKNFGLEEIRQVLVDNNFATSSGYAGQKALALSLNVNKSLDSLLMQSKSYSEIYRLLGWIHPTPTSRLTFIFTFLGAHAVELIRGDRNFASECALGICYPTDILEVDGGYQIRPFATILRTMAQLEGRLSRDEMIIGPLSLPDDRDSKAFEAMVKRLRTVRGNQNALTKAMADLSNQRGISYNTMGNYTRFPLAFILWAGWATKQRRRNVYPVNTVFQELTSDGWELANRLSGMTDIRKSDFNSLLTRQKNALHRLGFYSLMKRAKFDLSMKETEIAEAEKVIRRAGSRFRFTSLQLLYSPFQQVRVEDLKDAFPQAIMSRDVESAAEGFGRDVAIAPLPQLSTTISLTTSGATTAADVDAAIKNLFEETYQKSDLDFSVTIDALFNKFALSGKDEFYPLVAKLFCCLGYNCEVSRHGVHSQRWDAVIKDDSRSIPIEIKSPGEELNLSVKAVRQAVENKVIITARESYPTTWETTSLVVGYHPPRDRSDVTNLIGDMHYAYEIRIGIVDFRSLLRLAGATLLLGKTHTREKLEQLYGLIQIAESI